MTIKNLQNIPVEMLAETFNHAFSDYLVPIQVSEHDLWIKMASENTFPEFSAGVFSKKKL
jgi:hypothetical protein